MANGNFGGGTGTSDDPYLVEDAKDLKACITINKHYKQIADIDLSEYNTGTGFEPVLIQAASEGNYTYDGNGYKILNLYQNRPETHEAGVFRLRPIKDQRYHRVFTYNFKNISIINANVTSKGPGILATGVGHTTNNSAYGEGARTYINVTDCFVSGQLTCILNGNITVEHYNTGVIGTLDPKGKEYLSTQLLSMTGTTAVLDVNIQVSDCPNKIFNIGLLGIKKNISGGHAMYTRISNSCVHAEVNVDKTDDTAIINVYGVAPEFINTDINNVYVNATFNNMGSKEGVNFFYFTPSNEYTSNLIANHEKGKVNGIDFDNRHYLTDEQMKDLTYYKNLGWTIYE